MQRRTLGFIALLASPAVALAAPTIAATDAGTLLKGIEKQFQQQETAPQPEVRQREAIKLKAPTGTKIKVHGFKITGAKLILEAELQARLKDYIGRELTFGELEKAAQVIAEYYREKGFVVRAILPPQDIVDGIVEIVVLEGKMSSIKIEDGGLKLRISREIVLNIVEASQKTGEPARQDRIERGLLLLNEMPGVVASGTLEAGERAGDTVLNLKLADGLLIDGSADVSNYGSRSTGAEQLTAMMNINDPSGIGDQISFRAMKTEGTEYFRAAYTLPIGYEGLRIGANASTLKYHLIGEFEPLKASGSAETYGLVATYPLIRSREFNAGLSAAYDRKQSINFAAGGTTSDKTVDVASVGFSGNSFDEFLGGGFNVLSATLYSGSTDLSGNQANLAADDTTAKTNGSFWKTGLIASRQQKINETLSLLANLSGQWSGKNLDTGEKFYLGGPNGVRAYPVSEGGGDEGYMLNLELRKSFNKQFQGIVFYDRGSVTQNRNMWTAPIIPNTYALSGAGFGINAAVGSWIAKASLAWRLEDNPARSAANGTDGDGTKHIPTGWAQLIKTF